jgi:hypothetical protein
VLLALRAATLLVGPGVGICVLGLVAASEEAAGASLFHIRIGFHDQLLPDQPPVLQPVVMVSATSTTPEVSCQPLNRVTRMGENPFSPPAAGAHRRAAAMQSVELFDLAQQRGLLSRRASSWKRSLVLLRFKLPAKSS